MHVTSVRKDRPLEWFLAGFSIWWGLSTHMAPDALDGAYCPAALQPFTQPPWAAGGVMLGLAHMVGLLINGTMWWTPLLRLVVTAANSGFFAWVASVMIQHGFYGAGSVYAYTTTGFLWCAYAAGQDAARMRLGTYGL